MDTAKFHQTTETADGIQDEESPILASEASELKPQTSRTKKKQMPEPTGP